MKIWNVDLSLFAAALAMAAAPAAWSQGRLYDKVTVDFPNDFHVNEQVLPKGHYELRQARDSGGVASVMLIAANGGSRISTDAITIPVLDNNTPNKTLVVMQKVGSDYYLQKVWISGKDYGYEFALPASVKSRLKEQGTPLTLTTNYQAAQPVAAAEPAPAAPAPPPPVAEATPAPAPAPEVAQNNPPPAAQPETPPAPPEQNTPPPQNPPNRIPETSSGWANYLALGFFAAGIATLLRFRRRGRMS